MTSIAMEIEITSRTILKPSSPTPPHLKIFKLSLLDQLSTDVHGNITFFYSDSEPSDFSAKSLSLQNSLSHTLTRFYPLAGRFLDNATVHCSDDGVCLVEARTNRPLSAYLSHPNLDSLDGFIPSADAQTMELANGCLLIVQFTALSCGGTAVGLSLSHKIADIAALLTLLKSWTATARGSTNTLMPEFIGASVFPPRDLPPMSSSSISIAKAKFSARRFVFTPAKIADLKALVAAALGSHHRQIIHPTRVEVVLALIWKCAISAHKSRTGSFKASAMFQAVNLRRRMDPPLPDSAIGNFIWPFMVVVVEEEKAELHDLVAQMRKAMTEFNEEKANKLRGEEAFATIMGELKERGEVVKSEGGVNVYKCTSWCRFPILDTDFGWGRPVWHYSANKMVSNTIAVMDTDSGDGVEAVVTLDDDELGIFECNQELLAYASVNPTVNFLS